MHEPSLNTNIGGLVPSISVQYIYYSHPFLYGAQCNYGESHTEGCVRVPRSALGGSPPTQAARHSYRAAYPQGPAAVGVGPWGVGCEGRTTGTYALTLPVHHTVHACIRGSTHGRGAYTNIDDASQDTGKGVRVQLSTHLSARFVYTTDTPTSLYRWGEGGEGRTSGTRGEGRRATAGA